MTGMAGFLRRHRALALVVLGCALLAGLGWWIGRELRPGQVSARPALWLITRGDSEAYLFGTIHAVPQRSRWLGPIIADAMARSDRLVLEVTGLETERRDRAIFMRLGRSSGLPPVTARLTSPDDARLRALIARDPTGLHGLDGYKSWAAALLVNASAASGLDLSAEAAPEPSLARAFRAAGKTVSGLETIAGQLGLFDGLAEADQRALLVQAVREADQAPTLYRQLYEAWAYGDLVRLETQFLVPLAATPALQAALVDRRNARWAETLDRDLSRNQGVAFVAVGAGHLVGAGNLLDAMTARGWRVRRLQ